MADLDDQGWGRTEIDELWIWPTFASPWPSSLPDVRESIQG